MRHTNLARRLALAPIAALLALAILPSGAGAQEKPFEPAFEVNPANPNADTPVQVQVFFDLAEGNSFIKTASFRIPAAYQITNSDDMTNGDIVGDGTLSIKFGALGQLTPSLCLANKAPNTPGAYSTLVVGVQLGSSNSADCNGLFSLTISLTKFPDGQYGFDFSLPGDI